MKIKIGKNTIEAYHCANLKLEGNKLYQINKITGIKHLFVDSKDYYTVPAKYLKKVKYQL